MKAIHFASLILAALPALAATGSASEITDTCLSRLTECEAIETSLESRDMPVSDYDGRIVYLPRYRMISSFGYTLQMTEEFFHGKKPRLIQLPRVERAVSEWKADEQQARTDSLARCQDQRADLQRQYPACK